MLRPYQITQFLPQFVMWRIVNSKCVMVGSCESTPLLLTTHYIVNYGKNCIILFDPSIAHNTTALLGAIVTPQI